MIKRFPHKHAKLIGNGLRPGSAGSFLNSLDLVFQREKAKGFNDTFHFVFTGEENISGTVILGDRTMEFKEGLHGNPDVTITADAATWVRFLAKEKKMIVALLQRKIKIKGRMSLMKHFVDCFPL